MFASIPKPNLNASHLLLLLFNSFFSASSLLSSALHRAAALYDCVWVRGISPIRMSFRSSLCLCKKQLFLSFSFSFVAPSRLVVFAAVLLHFTIFVIVEFFLFTLCDFQLTINAPAIVSFHFQVRELNR
jgi:hypothetical protein